MRTDWVLPVR